MMHNMQNLTDDEKKSLENMTDAQKKEFFQNRMKEQKTKMEARDVVIDKLLNGESLTDADKVIVEAIKIERAKMKSERTQMDVIRTKLEKNESLSMEEQAFLDKHKPQRGERKHHENILKSMKK